jgi:pilus assembly protein CpaC
MRGFLGRDFKLSSNQNQKKIVGLFLILIFVICSLAYAQLFLDDEVELYIGQTKLFPVKKPTRVAVGKPEIADVIDVSEANITLAAKGAGTTTLIYWDVFGEHSYKIKVLTEDMTDVKKRIDALLKELNLPHVYTKRNDQEGKVLLLGEVKSQEEKDRIDVALGELKPKTIDLIKIKDEGIVEIDVQVLELDKDASKTLGFSWPGTFTFTDVSGPTTSAGATSYSTLFHISDWTRTALTHTLDLLVQEGKARILSQPKLVCLSGKEAELLVGGEKPIFTTAIQATAGSTTTVEYKEYGIILNIRPTIKDEERIHIALGVEVSEIGTAETIGDPNAPTAKAYPLSKRNISTELYLNDGQTLAIGGLTKQKKEEDIRKTPFLGDIPILGALFRKKTVTKGGGAGERGDIELFITLTPTIISGGQPKVSATQVSRTYYKPVTPEVPLKANIPEGFESYIRDVQSKIINAIYYPPEARKLGWEGTVKLNIFLDNKGNLKKVEVSKSSGYDVLDEAAVDVVRKQAPYPAFPPQAKLSQLRINIPIAYRKDN